MCRALLLLMFLRLGVVFGQSPQSASASLEARQGHLSGRVVDPTDAVIPAATVTIHSIKGKIEKTVQTDRIGRFQFEDLALGQYTITVTHDGFAEYHGKFTLTPSKDAANVDARLKIATDQEQVDVDTKSDALDPNNNPDGLTLNENQIQTLSDDPGLLSQELQGLAGSAQSNIYVDGFSGQSIPPKSIIREIRINQNSYSAKNDTDPIQGLIEIFTKPGTEKLHGSFVAFGNDSAFDAKNWLTPNEPAYHSYQWFGNLSGPLTKHSAYFFNGSQFASSTSTTIAAEILDANDNPVSLTEASPSRRGSLSLNPRVDLQLSTNDTLSLRYQFGRSTSDGGASGISLPSQASNSERFSQGFQLINTQTIARKILNETRFQYLRSRSSINPYTTNGVTIAVQGAFTDGGSAGGHSQDNQDSYEFQDYVSLASHKHFLNFGVRLRSVRDANNSSANYNGEYTFGGGLEPVLDANNQPVPGQTVFISGLEQYRRTLLNLPGGGASQFSITQGNSSIAVSMTDVGLFYEDDWKWKPNFTLSYGLRYEAQTHISDHRDFAPRLGFAWNLGPKKSPYTLSGGNGFFYHRFTVASIMNAERSNGLNQQHYILLDPGTFPAIPPISTLAAQTSSSNYEIDPRFRAEDVYVASINLAHTYFKNFHTSVNYWYAGGFHGPLTRNINTPLPGTYDPTIPGSGVRPYGGTNNIFQYQSEGQFRYYRLMPNFTFTNSKGAFVSANYQLVWYTIDDTDGYTPNFVSNEYNLKADRGPGSLDTRNNISVFGSTPLPWHFRADGFVFANSASPFNILVGQDLNGDSIFNDRPAFATDLTRPSVVTTKWGTFDTDPLPTQTIIPFNYGRAPASIQTGFELSRMFTFGAEQKAPPGMKGPLPRKYTLQLTVQAANVFNHPNLSGLNPTLGSPLFGQSQSTGQPRSIELQSQIRF